MHNKKTARNFGQFDLYKFYFFNCLIPRTED